MCSHCICIWDGIDADCGFDTDFDVDGDGFEHDGFGGTDRNDDDANVKPGALDVPYDGEDTDCDGSSDYDLDGDGYDSDAYGGPDCNDNDPNISPAQSENVTTLTIDENCNGSLLD